MSLFFNTQENETNQHLSHTTTSQQIPNITNPFMTRTQSANQEESGLGHFMDIASNFWNKKFDEKARELNKENFIPKTFTQIQTFDQINQENYEDLLDDNFIQQFNWDPSSDEALLELAFQFNCDWIKVSRRFPHLNVSPILLKERYRHLHNVKLANKARFTVEEDRKILKYFQIYGTNWKVISSLLPGRAPTTIKNRYYSSLRTRVQRFGSAPTPFTHSSPIEPIFSNLPRLRRDSFENMGMVSNLPQQMEKPYFECDQFFDFNNNQVNEFNDILEFKNNNLSQNSNHQQIMNFSEIPSYNYDNVQPRITEFDTYEWNDMKTVRDITNNQTYKSSQVDQENIPGEDESRNSVEKTQKDPNARINELNNRVQSVMSLCYQIQQEMERTREKVDNYTQSEVY